MPHSKLVSILNASGKPDDGGPVLQLFPSGPALVAAPPAEWPRYEPRPANDLHIEFFREVAGSSTVYRVQRKDGTEAVGMKTGRVLLDGTDWIGWEIRFGEPRDGASRCVWMDVLCHELPLGVEGAMAVGMAREQARAVGAR